MASAHEKALWAVEDARRELSEAEASGDHEAVLIWTRTLWEAKLEESATVFDTWEPEDGDYFR